MRILVVIPHYYGQSQPEYKSLGSYIEPISRVAAFTETIVGLYRHFGQNRHTVEGVKLLRSESSSRLHIHVLTRRDSNLLSELSFDPGTFDVEYVDCKPAWIPLQVPRVLKNYIGMFDFYCYLEDDLIINDPLFFSKLVWFQQTFGLKTVLAPVRFEMSSSGTAAKVIFDPILPDFYLVPFRRPGQCEEITGIWHGSSQVFQLPQNPHAASFFLTEDQLAYWMKQPSFDDGDSSWVGPIESAATLTIGKVFDIYKPKSPDHFFLELQHYGSRYASKSAPPGFRYGDPPILSFAQKGFQAAATRSRGVGIGGNAGCSEVGKQSREIDGEN